MDDTRETSAATGRPDPPASVQYSRELERLRTATRTYLETLKDLKPGLRRLADKYGDRDPLYHQLHDAVQTALGGDPGTPDYIEWMVSRVLGEA